MSIVVLWWKCWWRYMLLYAFTYVLAVYAATPPNQVFPSWFPSLVLIALAVFMAIWWCVVIAGLVLTRRRS